MEEKKKSEEVKMIKPKLRNEELPEIDEDELYERQYYQDSIIIKVSQEDGLIDDIATCFDIENTMELLMLAPLEFMSRTDGIENEKEYKERLWKQVRNFYKAARDILDRRYRL